MFTPLINSSWSTLLLQHQVCLNRSLISVPSWLGNVFPLFAKTLQIWLIVIMASHVHNPLQVPLHIFYRNPVWARAGPFQNILSLSLLKPYFCWFRCVLDHCPAERGKFSSFSAFEQTTQKSIPKSTGTWSQRCKENLKTIL